MPPPPISDFQSRYPTRDRRPPARFADYANSCSTNHSIFEHLSYDGLSGSYRAFLGCLDSISIPQSLHEALQNPKWVAAMKTEMDALENNGTWELVSLPPGEKLVRYKWVFSVKYLADGSVE